MSRIITALIVLPFLIASIMWQRLWPLFVALAFAAMALALYEFWLLAAKRGMKTDMSTSILGAVALFVSFLFDAPAKAPDLLLLVLIGFVILCLVAQMTKGAPFEKLMANCGATMLGVFYIVFLGGHLVALRMSFESQPQLAGRLLGYFFVVVMGSDVGAYYVGRAFGRHKLAKDISPGKTWEGFAGGFAASILLALGAHYAFLRDLPLKFCLPLAGGMAIMGVLGDLTESAIKRGAGAKDAAQILPGHGGLLDRLDSLLFNAPLIYYFARFYFGSQ